MPYCSIEEAWGSTFNPKKNRPTTNYRNIVPDNAKNNLDEYADIDFDNDNVYTSSGKPVLCKEKKKKRKRRKSFSRTTNRLADTSGPKNRYVYGDNYKQLQFSDNTNQNNSPVKLLRDQSRSTYKNTDVPISDYNKDLEQELYNEQKLSNRNISGDSSFIKTINEESDEEIDTEDEVDFEEVSRKNFRQVYQEDTDINLQGRHITNIEQEVGSKQLESYKDLQLQDLEKDRVNKMRDNMFDIIVYVITGVFLIFILDLFVRLGKNSKS